MTACLQFPNQCFKFHFQPTLSESIKLPQDHLVISFCLSSFGMKDNVSFHLIISFNYDWSGHFKSVINHELTHHTMRLIVIKTLNPCPALYIIYNICIQIYKQLK